MTPTEHNPLQIEDFLNTVGKIASTYRYAAVTYAVVIDGAKQTIVSAKLELSPWPLSVFEAYRSPHILIDRFEMHLPNLRNIIHEVMTGSFKTPKGTLLLPMPLGGCYLSQNKSSALSDAVAVLRIPGQEFDKIVPEAQLVPELNSGIVHYHGSRELLQDKGLSYDLGAVVFEIVAMPIIAIRKISRQFGGKLRVVLEIPPGAGAELVTANCRYGPFDAPVKLGSTGERLKWRPSVKGQSADILWRVPKDQAFTIRASYDHLVQATYLDQNDQQHAPLIRKAWADLQDAFPIFRNRPLVIFFIALGALVTALFSPIIGEVTTRLFERIWPVVNSH